MSERAFLNVEKSLTGRRWIGPDVETDRLAEAMEQATGLHAAVCHTLVRQGVLPRDTAAYLSPSLRDLLPDPMNLTDMGVAADRFLKAYQNKQKIAVFADYDVDGASSAALILTWLTQLGHQATLYVPDRIDEGYGPNEAAMAMLANDHDLIICVDCGTVSHDPIAAAKNADVIVLDHHLGGDTLPAATAVVNPNRQDEDGTLGHLCAAGVVFLFLVEANRRLRASGVTGPDLMGFLDLVGLATIADVAPLTGVNRAFVRQGLKVMAKRQRPGLVALADVARLDTAATAYHLGFVLGPRINAGGRVGRADLGARLLTCSDPAEAASIADKLDQLNTERREIEARVRDAALEQAEERGFDAPLVWAAGNGWHPGVVGIVASRIKELTNRPVVVIGIDGDTCKGSGRSVSGIDLGAAVQNLAAEGLLEKGGGHKMAAGLSLSRDQLEPAMARLSELLKRQGAAELGPRELRLTGILMSSAINVELINQIDTAGPFGAGAPAPRFVFPDQPIRFCKRVGSGHLKISFGNAASGPIDAICFGAFDGALGPEIENHGGNRFHLAGRLEINTWGGKSRVQLRLEDAAPAQG
ncbi:MAG: single-stranded-DNA-specific exonuclease RecJ [Paracoccaceae bacterium]